LSDPQVRHIEPLKPQSEMLTKRFDRALHYARVVHDGQKRKGTQAPYFSHLLAVASIVLENGGTEDEAIAARLHDAAEDQGGAPRLEDIRTRCGPRVAEIVEACSDSLEEDASKRSPWHGRKKRCYGGKPIRKSFYGEARQDVTEQMRGYAVRHVLEVNLDLTLGEYLDVASGHPGLL
jgi:hypothetical protein